MEEAPQKTQSARSRAYFNRRGMIDTALRPGYAALETARTLPLKDAAWLPLMRDLLQLPAWMLPAAQLSIGKGAWRFANDPVRSVRENSEREVIRMDLREGAGFAIISSAARTPRTNSAEGLPESLSRRLS